MRRSDRKITDPDTVVFLNMVNDPGLIQCLFKFCLIYIELPDFSGRHADHIDRISEILQAALVDHGHLAARTGYVFDDMGGEDHDTIFTQFHQQVTETDTLARVESGSRFVYH